jgi:hypothetical protein
VADNRMTLLDFAKSQDPNGAQAQVLELQNQFSPILQDAPAYPSNAPYGHRITLRRSLPSVGTAKLNKGVTKSKSTTDQRVDTIGFFSGRSEVDVRFRKVEGDGAFAAKRKDEDMAFEEALAQLITNTTFYGDVKLDEASFDGFAPRMGTLNPGTTLTDPQVHSMGTVTGADGCSLYVIDWGERAAHLIYNPNVTAGLDVADLGEQSVLDVDSNPFQAAVTLYEQFVGLAVKDPRHIGRLANIDLSDALVDAPTQGKLFDKMEVIFSLMPEPGGASRVIYCPLKLYAGFLKQARSVSNLALSMGEYLGKPTPMMWGYPLRRSDQLAVNEATVA